jgi:hypothetical protein
VKSRKKHDEIRWIHLQRAWALKKGGHRGVPTTRAERPGSKREDVGTHRARDAVALWRWPEYGMTQPLARGRADQPCRPADNLSTWNREAETPERHCRIRISGHMLEMECFLLLLHSIRLI